MHNLRKRIGLFWVMRHLEHRAYAVGHLLQGGVLASRLNLTQPPAETVERISCYHLTSTYGRTPH